MRGAVPVVGAALVDGPRVLVARRGPGMSLPGKWELPGGKVEVGEAPEAALAREPRDAGWVERNGVVLEGLDAAGNDEDRFDALPSAAALARLAIERWPPSSRFVDPRHEGGVLAQL